MGIDKSRFTANTSISIDKFFCGICQDVASDPILTNECEHYLCRSCVVADINFCPTCGFLFRSYVELGAALRRVYSNIKLRCIYKSCKESLTIENHLGHEAKCPEGFYECPNLCGFKVRLSLDVAERTHNCIEILQSKIVALETSKADLQGVNEKLNIEIEKLRAENACHLSALGSQKKRRVTCGTVLSKGEKFYRCYTCQIRRLSVICLDCFQNGEHENHRYAFLEVDISECYCDCGDAITLQESATCLKHKFRC